MSRSLHKLSLLVLLFTVCFSLWAGSSAEAWSLIGTKQEIELGQSVAKDLEKKYGLVDDPALQERIAQIGARIAAASDRTDLTYSFKVLNAKEVNALAIPGGYIYIFKGLVDYMPSDEELAGVIGHEVGHISKRHTVRQIEKSLKTSLLFGIVFGDRGMPLQNLAFNAIMAGYSREDEREADRLGFVHAVRAGYNPYSMLMSLRKLSELERQGSYGLFSSHPEPEARMKLLQGYLDGNRIRPVVVEQGKGAVVADGSWSLPPIETSHGGYKPVYRAYFIAGMLHLLSQRPDFNADRFVLDTDGVNYMIYYDDSLVATITPQDAVLRGGTAADLAGTYLSAFRAWAGQVRAPAA